MAVKIVIELNPTIFGKLKGKRRSKCNAFKISVCSAWPHVFLWHILARYSESVLVQKVYILCQLLLHQFLSSQMELLYPKSKCFVLYLSCTNCQRLCTVKHLAKVDYTPLNLFLHRSIGFRAAINICQGKTASSSKISIWKNTLNVKKQKENTYLYLFNITPLHLTSVLLFFHSQNSLTILGEENVQPDPLRGTFQQVLGLTQ